MRAVFAAAAAVAALVFTDTAFGGSPKDQDDCERKGEPDRRIAACSRLIKDRSETRYNLAAYYNNRGNAWRRKGDFDRAIADGTEAIRLAPKLAAAHYNRGAAWRDKGNLDRAIDDFTEALRLNPKFVEALVGRGVASSAMGNLDRAIADYNEAIRLDPNNTTPYISRGLDYFRKGDFSAAAAGFRGPIESKDAAYLVLFRYLARARTGESATAELETSSARIKSKQWPFAAIELHLGRRSPEATLDAAGDANARCEAQFYIGEWHLLRGDQANAKSALQIAVDTCPRNFVEYSAAVAELKRMTP